MTTDLGARAAVLITSLIVARAVAPPTFGAYLAWVAVALLATVVWDAGVSVLAQRQIAMDPGHAGNFVRQALRLRLITLPAWVVAFTVGIAIVAQISDLDYATAVLFMGTSLAAGLRMLAAATLHGKLEFARAGLALAMGRWATACASLAVYIPEHETEQLTVAAAALCVGEAVALAASVAAIGRVGRVAEGNPPDTVTLRKALPLAANAVMVQVYNRMDILLVALLTSASQVALYAPASRLQDALYMLPGAVGAVALSILSRQFGLDPSRARIQRSISAFIVIGLAFAVPVALVLTLFMPAIVELLLGDAYLGSVQAARILVWSVVSASVVAPLIAALIAVGRARDTTKVFGSTLIIALVLHASLDWWAGAIGAAIASLGRDVGALITAFVVASRAGILPRTITAWSFGVHEYRESEQPSK